MEDLNDKVLGGTLQAPEWNQVPSELQNVIENTGQTLSDANLNQVGIGVAHYAANGDFYTDSGAADAYVLTAVGLKQSPDAYTDGFRIRFVADNASTGASTVNVATLGAKTFKTEAGADLAANAIIAGKLVIADYDTASGFFILRQHVRTDIANTFTATQTWSKGADIASATALTLGTDGNYFDVTGTTTITSINTSAVGTVIKLHFDGILILTHDATDLVLPGAANYTTAAGDEIEFTEYASGDWRVTGYALATGGTMVASGGADYIYVRDEWANGFRAGASVAGTQVRRLTNIVSDVGGHASLASNQVTLAAGTYEYEAAAPGFGVAQHKIWLYNATDTAIVTDSIGDSRVSVGSNDYATSVGRFTIATSKAIEIVHYTAAVKTINGLGDDTSSGQIEVYASIRLWKVA